MTLLWIDSSAQPLEASTTRRLTARIVERLQADDPTLDVEHLDLGQSPLGHLTVDGPNADEGKAAARALAQFQAAETLVVGAPMYNFTVPSSLKAWVDRIAIAGETFRYTEQGPEGLAGGKRVILAIGCGGVHAGQPSDFVEPYLRSVFGFLGINRVETVRVEGVAMPGVDVPERIAQAVSEWAIATA